MMLAVREGRSSHGSEPPSGCALDDEAEVLRPTVTVIRVRHASGASSGCTLDDEVERVLDKDNERRDEGSHRSTESTSRAMCGQEQIGAATSIS